MQPSLIRKVRKKRRSLYRIYMRANAPVLFGMMLPFVAATSFSVKNAVALMLEMLIIGVFTAFFGALLCQKLQYWSKAAVYMGLATISMVLGRALITWIFPDISNYLGIYIYLMALNGMTLLENNRKSRNSKPLYATVSAALNAVVFGLVMLVVSLIREYFGNGAIWGVPVTSPIRLSGLTAPFAGLILMGVLGALVRFTVRKYNALTTAEAGRRAAHEEMRYTAIHVEPPE